MDLDIVFLGTAGSTPTPQRSLSATLVRRGGERVLIDCGEGTQRQLMRSTGLGDIDVVLITHTHADHFLGLPGMMKTFTLREREADLLLIAPREFVQLYPLLNRLIGMLSFRIDLQVAEPGVVSERAGYAIEAFRTEHSVPSMGYRMREHDRPGRFDVDAARALGVKEGPDFRALQHGTSVRAADGSAVSPYQVVGPARAGRTLVFTGDTRACATVREQAEGADVLVHEATFLSEEAERARETCHSTAHDAALTAAAANVKLLAITHSSNRYAGRELVAEARSVFPHTVCPNDFDLIEVPFAERGEPKLVKCGARAPSDAPRTRKAETDPAVGLA